MVSSQLPKNFPRFIGSIVVKEKHIGQVVLSSFGESTQTDGHSTIFVLETIITK